MNVTAFSIGQRFVGMKEVPGPTANPQILAMLRLDGDWPQDDSVPWCSAWANWICWLLRLPRSKSLAARSWLGVGLPIDLHEARPGFDVVVLSRPQGGPTAGHVGFFAGLEYDEDGTKAVAVQVLGGNQGNQVSVAPFPVASVLGVRRLS